MKKTFVLVTAVISTIVLMLSIGVNFAQAQEERDTVIKSCEMTVEHGETMMEYGKTLKECSPEDKATMTKEGEMMIQEGTKMKEAGKNGITDFSGKTIDSPRR